MMTEGIDNWHIIVGSSHIQALAYEPAGEVPLEPSAPRNFRLCAGCDTKVRYGTLFVAFHNGSIYSYAGVSEDDYQAIRSAKSVGGAFHRLVEQRRGKLVGRYPPEEQGDDWKDPQGSGWKGD